MPIRNRLLLWGIAVGKPTQVSPARDPVMHTPIILLLACLVASPLLAKPQPVTALPSGDAIAIDGKLDDAAWQTGEWSSGFTMLDNPAKPAPVQTRFKVRHDASNVYIGAELDEPQIADMKAAATERDGKVWSDDCIEVMLDPTGERIEYNHFMVNSLGAIYDAQMRQGGHVRSQEWDCGIQSAATVGAGKWFAEMRIPVVELGLTAASRGDWAINVTRARRVSGEELSTYSPLTGGFHQPSLYAALKMRDADFGAFLWEVKSPYEVRIQPDAAGPRRVRRARFRARASRRPGPGVRGTERCTEASSRRTHAPLSQCPDAAQAHYLRVR